MFKRVGKLSNPPFLNLKVSRISDCVFNCQGLTHLFYPKGEQRPAKLANLRLVVCRPYLHPKKLYTLSNIARVQYSFSLTVYITTPQRWGQFSTMPTELWIAKHHSSFGGVKRKHFANFARRMGENMYIKSAKSPLLLHIYTIVLQPLQMPIT